MASKPDIIILTVAVVTFLSAFASYIIIHAPVPTTDWGKIAFPLVMISLSMLLIFGYASYWAFNIRRGLAVGLYRNQALGIGLIGASYGVSTFVSNASLILTQGNGIVGFFLNGPPTFYVPILTIFYWLDAFVLASRRSDPDFRDALHWTRLRKILWTLILFGVIFDLVAVAYVYIVSRAIPGPPLQSGANLLTVTVLAIIILPNFVTVIAGALALPIIARRSRDLTLRRQLKWFALFVVFLLMSGVTNLGVSVITVAIPSLNNSFLLAGVANFIIFLAIAIAGYCLYRSARALIPGAEKLPTFAVSKI